MPVEFNHTIVWSKDAQKSARFLAEILWLPEPSRLYHFEVVTTANGVNVDFADTEGAIGTQHYAFLVSEPEFDAVFGRGDGRRRWQGMRMAIGECFFRVGVRHHQRPSMRATKPEMSW